MRAAIARLPTTPILKYLYMQAWYVSQIDAFCRIRVPGSLTSGYVSCCRTAAHHTYAPFVAKIRLMRFQRRSIRELHPTILTNHHACLEGLGPKVRLCFHPEQVALRSFEIKKTIEILADLK